MSARLLLTVVLAFMEISSLRAQERSAGIIKGRVTDAVTGRGIPFQHVKIIDSPIAAVTDDEGSFVLAGVPLGTHTVQATGVGYASTTVDVVLTSETGTTDVIMPLMQEPIALAEVQIVLEPLGKNADMPVSLHALTGRQIQSAAGTMDDVVRALSALPGVAPMRLERQDLIVRGGAPLENLYLVDNIEFPALSHFAVQGLGTGSASMINTEFIDNIAFSSGGFGVRHGDKLSSVLSLSMRDGNRDHHAAAAMLSATQFGVNLEGPATEDGSYIVSARRSYLEPVFKAYDMNFSPVYWDVFMKVRGRVGPADHVEALAVGSADRIHSFRDIGSSNRLYGDFVFSDQDMLVGGITWKHVTHRWYMTGTLSHRYGRYDYYQIRTDTAKASRIASLERETTLSLECVMPVTATTEFSLGLTYNFIHFNENAHLGELPWSLSVRHNATRIDEGVDAAGMKHAGYVQLSQSFGKVVVTAGMRADYFTMTDAPLAAAPRLSVSYRDSSFGLFTMSAGRYYQSPGYQWFINPYNRHLGPAGADQIVAGFTRRMSDTWQISLEGYRKRYFDYPSSIGNPVLTLLNAGSSGTTFRDFGLDSLANNGNGLSRGIELMVKSASDARLSGSVSVCYSKTTFTASDGVTRPADHDQRWIVNIAGGYRFGTSWEVTGKFLLFTGHPYTDAAVVNAGTASQYAQEYNGRRVGTNHMLDVRIMRRWNVGTARMEAFIDVQNVYNNKPFDTPMIDPATGRYRETAIIGIVPSVGVKVYL
jgi:hypothetical protein